jgi:hypothetical protein
MENNALNTKPISPKIHGLIDYAFALALLVVPELIDSKKKTRLLYKIIAAEVFLYGAISKHPYAITPIIPFSLHKKIDIGNLTGLTLLSAYNGIRKHQPTLLFHAGMTVLGITTVLLTDWNNNQHK